MAVAGRVCSILDLLLSIFPLATREKVVSFLCGSRVSGHSCGPCAAAACASAAGSPHTIYALRASTI